MSAEERRQTPTERNHEVVMALATKTAPRGNRWKVTAEQQKIGDLKGQWLGSIEVAPEDGEDWPQFLGRWSSMLDDVERDLARRNAGPDLAQQLADSIVPQSLKAVPDPKKKP